MASAGMNKIERAHEMYREGRYEEALVFYTEALSTAKTNPHKIALHSNRAACFLKLHLFNKAAEECTSVLELDHKHTGALMLRAQTLVTLKEYHSALFDVSRLMELNPSSEVYQNLQARLKTQLSLAPIPEAEAEFEEEDERTDEAEVKEEDEDKHEADVNEDEDEHEGKEMEDEQGEKDSVDVVGREKGELGTTIPKTDESISQNQRVKELSEPHSSGWKAIPKPKGHSHLDYSRWDRVEDDSSDDDDDDRDDEESQPQYRFRVRTVGVRPVK